MNETNVFVYGTLKKGNSRRGLNRWNVGATFIGDAVTADAKFDLYDLGAFPAVGLNGENHISGEVWSVDDATLEDLDRIEGYPDFYNRIEVNTTQGRAWMYYIPDIQSYRTSYIKPDTNNISSWREQ